MSKLLIENPRGNFDISGEIFLQGSKNSMLNNLCLPLLTDEECIVENVPEIEDVKLNLEVLKSFGASVKKLSSGALSIQCNEIKKITLKSEISQKTTGSKFFIPILVHKFGEYTTGAPGGCDIGERDFQKYADSLKIFGIQHKKEGNLYHFFKTEGKENFYKLPFPSFGLTVNAILAAVTSKKEITISNICQEPEIENSLEMLKKMGVVIEKVGLHELRINGRETLKGCRFRNMSDRNVAVTYAVMALITGSHLVINNYDNIKMEAFYRFLDNIQAKYEISANKLVILKANNLQPINLKAFLYPEFHSDWQPLVAPLLTQIHGQSSIYEELFSNRLQYWKELGKMGANFEFDFDVQTRFTDNSPHVVKIFGATTLKGAEVKALDLRGGAALLIASLVAKGNTIIENAEQIFRGYENIPEKLTELGVNIEIVE